MSCLLCASDSLQTLLVTAPLPISHHFSEQPHTPERYPLHLLQCQDCALVQLENLPPSQALRPAFSWMRYLEPESHLDELAQWLRPRLDTTAPKVGLTYKDESLLQRLERLGCPDFRCLEGLELGEPERIDDAWPEKFEGCDLVVARHVFEHSPDPLQLVKNILRHMRPEGILVLEIPDTVRSMDLGEYTTLWEEHSMYLGRATMEHALQRLGLQLLFSQTYPQAMEDSIVTVWSTRPGTTPVPLDLPLELSRGARFGREFPAARSRVQERVAALSTDGPLAVLGSGHLTCTYLHLMEITASVDLIVDDNPNKIGLFFPGTNLRIQSSQALRNRPHPHCLLGVNPENEAAVFRRQQPFLQSGGRFHSIFPSSKIHL
ncbi:MAG: methyltransferase domain-containing protein [Candidatus Eremiobacteraeota bacterium]|nr:methyltransferase domain-containing protein [Candidatus Eremiobacteraeota bacterium]